MKKQHYIIAAFIGVALLTGGLARGVEPPKTAGYARSVMYVQMDLPEMALAELERVRDQLPAEREVYIFYGLLLESLGRYDQAVTRYRQSMTLPAADGAGDTKATALAFAGRAMKKKGDSREAERLFREALAADQDVAVAHLGLAGIMVERGDYAGSVKPLEMALSQDPDDLQALIMLATSYAATDQKAMARKTLEQALGIDPGNKEAKGLLKSL
jgi:Tfp pilus assembly protein PilF